MLSHPRWSAALREVGNKSQHPRAASGSRVDSEPITPQIPAHQIPLPVYLVFLLGQIASQSDPLKTPYPELSQKISCTQNSQATDTTSWSIPELLYTGQLNNWSLACLLPRRYHSLKASQEFVCTQTNMDGNWSNRLKASVEFSCTQGNRNNSL